MKVELKFKKKRLNISWTAIDQAILRLTGDRHVKITLDKNGLTMTQLRNACNVRFDNIQVHASPCGKYMYISLKEEE